MVKGVRYNVWFHRELGDVLPDIDCSYCSNKPSKPQLAVIEVITDARASLVPNDSALAVRITKDLITKLLADETVCTRRSCLAHLQANTENAHHQAGVRPS